MFKALLSIIALIALSGGSILAIESRDTASEPAQKTSTEVLPDEITSLLNPKPTYKHGITGGPCTVSVNCQLGGGSYYTISCSGQTECEWRTDGPYPTYRGFVKCDGIRTDCGLIPVEDP